MKTFTSYDKQIQITYPSTWTITELDDGPDRFWSSVALKKGSASFQALWGDGLGGTCPEGSDTVQFKSVTVPCHYTHEGIEYWRGAYSKDVVNFTADASTDVGSASEREDILSIFNNLQLKD